MKILVPIDGSSYSENSLAFVASRATLLGHNPQIELLAVLAALPNRAARLVGKDSLTRYYEDEAEKIFKPARKYLKAQNIEATEAFLIGQPAEQIAEEAKRLNADHHGLARPNGLEGLDSRFRHGRRFGPHQQSVAGDPRQ